ncbi:ABC transporter substrate-binding protein [Lutibacter sp.]|uniref:ABC transporter substrate-binding protein n=1 Tax=Lutibacter sp. TaxID=1925666 RepID=UPI0027367912|nr:ABC transporter substrate-binding protein [Lutibacter sp.]MDP3311918.1 ABC transporter substrate-binding protein [Lutibacter sp.]
MRSYSIICIVLILSSIAQSSCNDITNSKKKEEVVGVKTQLKYAKGFEIITYKNYKLLRIKAPYQNATETFEYVLTTNKTKTNSELNTIQIPVKKLVVTSTTHIPMLELLESESKLIGYPNTDYISSEKTRKLIESGTITNLGNEEQINTELLINLHPEVVIGFSLSSNNKMFENIQQLGIPVLLNGDWLEESPLGRAEWIKFFGVLFDKEKEADRIFNKIEKNYAEAASLAKKATTKPTVISGGLFKDIWNLPAGDSFEAQFLNDAQTNYLWKNSKGKGSLTLNIENVFEKGQQAEIWISPSYFTTLSEMEQSNAIYKEFKAFKIKEVYSFVKKKGATGGVIYFELAPTRPDLVLKDLIKIAHPELLKNYELTFYERLK